MSKVYSYILNLILFLAFVGGVAFCSPSIKVFASSVSAVPDDYNQVCLKLFKGSQSTSSYDSSKSYVCKVNSAYNLLSYTWFSNSYIFNVEVEVYLTTTSGTYLIGAESTGRTGTVSLDTNVYYEGYPISYYAIAKGYLSANAYYFPSSSSSEGVLNIGFDIVENPSNSISSVKSDTQTIIRMLEDLDTDQIYDVLLDIWTYLNTSQRSQIANLLSSLISIDVEVQTIEDDLTSLMEDISLIKQSQCFDFPATIDGNYQLAMAFHSVSFANNNPLSLGYCAFDVNPDTVIYRIFIRVPSSKKIGLFFTPFESSSSFTVPTFYNKIYGTLSPTVSTFSSFSNFRVSYIDFSNTNVSVGDFIYFDMPRVYSSFRFAIYDYVVNANDILDYMKDQWSQSAPAVSDLDSHTSITDGFESSVASYEDGAFTSFSSAVDGTGIRAFDWSVFGGMSLFTAFVTGFYNLLPAEYALYITAVLIVGCVAVLLSAIGRVVKKGGENG